MKLTKKKFDEVVTELVGEQGLALVNLLKNRKNLSEFELADALKLDIKFVRQTLYKLYDRNLIESTRKKDKIKGWYIYYWTLLPENVHFFYQKTLRERITRLKEKTKQEETECYFTCPRSCIKLDFNQSLEFEFKCPECGELISSYNPQETIVRLKNQIGLFENELQQKEEIKLPESPPRKKGIKNVPPAKKSKKKLISFKSKKKLHKK